jgi:hypothetical protein
MGDPVDIKKLLGETADAVPAMVHPVAGTTYAAPGGVVESGFAPESPTAAAQASLDAARNELYGGIGGGASAAALGLLRGSTFSLIDPLLVGGGFMGADELRDRRAENPGISLGTEIVGGIATSAATGLAGIGAKLAPGSKAAAAVLGGTVEGMAFGAGQATSALILRNEPLTAEAVFSEYGTDIFLGGAFGGVGGALGHGLGKVGDKLIGRSATRLSKDPEVTLAANALEARAVPLESTRGGVLTDDFVKGVGASTKLADEFADEVAKRPVILEAPVAPAGNPKSISELPDEMFVGEGSKSGRNAMQFVFDASDEAVMSAKSSGNAALVPGVRKVESARRKLRGLIEDELPTTSSGPNATTVGTGATKGANPLQGAADPKRIKAVFGELHEATTKLADDLGDSGIIDNMMHGQADQGIRSGGLQQFFDEGAVRSAMPKLGSIEPAIKEAATAYKTAKAELFDRLYVRDGKIASKRTLQVLGELEPEEAFKVAQAYGTYVKSAGAMGDALGPEWTAKSMLLKEELSKVQKAVRSLTTPESGAASPSNIGTAELMGALGITAAIPDFDGPADDMAKLWLTAALLKGRFKGAGGEVAERGSSGFASKVRGFVSNTGGRVGYRMGAQGGGVVGGGIKGAIAGRAASWGLNKIMGSTVGLANATSRAASHAEAAVGHMLKATGKGVRKAAPFAPMALLKAVKFADIEHEPGSSEFEKRAREIRMNVANSYGVQKTVLDNLGELAVHHPGIADKVVAQADRTMKFLGNVLPRDPGTVTRLGRSGWKASEQDIAKFARYLRAALDPDAELQRFAEGDLSVEGAKVLRDLYPAKFAKFQEYIASNLLVLQEKLDYNAQVRMSVLFDVPVTSCMEPTAIKAFQATFAADTTNQPVSQPPPGSSGPSPLSPAQELLAR